MNRRTAIKSLSVLLGGTVSTSMLMTILQHCQAADWQPRLFSHSQQQLVAEIAELIIPATDTPGAKAALVDRFIDTMLMDCYDEADCQAFVEGLQKLDETCRKKHGKGFVNCEVKTQTALLKQAETQAEDVDDHFFPLMKELTLLGYFTSEIGATQALVYLPIPGEYQACIPLQGQSTWSSIDLHP